MMKAVSLGDGLVSTLRASTRCAVDGDDSCREATVPVIFSAIGRRAADDPSTLDLS